MSHYTSFGELMKSVLLLRKNHPDWQRLDGNEKGGNRDVFATFRYSYKTWKIHSDTIIEKLLDAWKIAESGEKPFVISRTDKGTSCLRLAEDDVDGLYIYLKD